MLVKGYSENETSNNSLRPGLSAIFQGQFPFHCKFTLMCVWWWHGRVDMDLMSDICVYILVVPIRNSIFLISHFCANNVTCLCVCLSGISWELRPWVHNTLPVSLISWQFKGVSVVYHFNTSSSEPIQRKIILLCIFKSMVLHALSKVCSNVVCEISWMTIMPFVLVVSTYHIKQGFI